MSVELDTPGAHGDPGFPPEHRLAGRTAIVTGAGTRAPGIGNGRAMAITFAREGAFVGLLDNRADWVEETHRLIAEEGGRSMVIEADVADEASCRQAVERVLGATGALHILVNNVGVTGPAGNAVEVDVEQFDRAMRINVTSMVLMSKFAVPAMTAAGGGSIINLSSVMGLTSGHPSLLYPISKTAVVGLTRTMAAHHGPSGIRVNAIAPGLVYTPMVAVRGMTEEMREQRRLAAPLQTEGTAWDIANTALFLASDESRWITGATLLVDAGYLAAIGQIVPGEGQR